MELSHRTGCGRFQQLTGMSRGWVNFYTHTSCFSWISLHAIQMVPCAAWFTLAVGPKDERGSAVVETKSRHVFERTGDQSLPWVREDEVVEHFAAGVFCAVCCSLRQGTPGQRGYCPKGALRSLPQVPASNEEAPRIPEGGQSPKGRH